MIMYSFSDAGINVHIIHLTSDALSSPRGWGPINGPPWRLLEKGPYQDTLWSDGQSCGSESKRPLSSFED